MHAMAYVIWETGLNPHAKRLTLIYNFANFGFATVFIASLLTYSGWWILVAIFGTVAQWCQNKLMSVANYWAVVDVDLLA